MPTKLRWSILTLLLVLTTGLLLIGQDAAPQSPQTSQTPMGSTAASPDAHFQMLSEKLNLTDEQKTKLKPMFEQQGQQLKAVKDDTALSQEQKKTKMKSIHESFSDQINAVLTPEQQTKFKEMKQEAMEKHHQ